jgi:hypothetical protein
MLQGKTVSRVAIPQRLGGRVNDAVEKCDEFIGRQITAQHAVELGADFRRIHSLCSKCFHNSLNVCHEKRGRDPFAHNVGNTYRDSGLSEFYNVKVVASDKPGWLVAPHDLEIWELRNLHRNQSGLNLS